MHRICGDHQHAVILEDGRGDLGRAGVGAGYDGGNLVRGGQLLGDVRRLGGVQTVVVVHQLHRRAVDAAVLIDELHRQLRGLLGALSVRRRSRRGYRREEADADRVLSQGAGGEGKNHHEGENQSNDLFHGKAS